MTTLTYTNDIIISLLNMSIYIHICFTLADNTSFFFNTHL